MQPPTISEDEDAEKAAEAGADLSTNGDTNEVLSGTEDKEVAAWVKDCLEKKAQGKMTFAKKPALHDAPLDAVPGSPLMTKDEAKVTLNELDAVEVKPNPGVRMNSPELVAAQVESVDFAGNAMGKGGD